MELYNERINIYNFNLDLMMNNKMVGREKEKNVVKKSLDRVMDSRGHTILISGEAGIGKTKFVEYLKNEAQSRGMEICLGETTVQDTSIPYFPFQKALSGLVDTQLFQSEEFVNFDEIFLISKIGLLISHVSRSKEGGLDEDILGSMLTAVQDFVKDSFGDGGAETQRGGLGKLEYMNTKIFIEHGDLVYLAVVTSGEEHPDMKQEIRRCLVEIESKYYDILADWDGDIDSLSGTTKILRRTVGAQFRMKRSLENINLETERIKVQNRILNLLTETAEKKGLLLVLEDIHWADASTLLTLPFISRNITDSKIAFCITYRPDDLSKTDQNQRIIESLSGEDSPSVHIPIKPIDHEALTNISSIALGGGTPPEDLVESLSKDADGNPLFIIEAIRTLISSGTLVKDNDLWILKHGPKAVLPHSVTELVSRRLESLSLDCLRFIEYCAVLGRRFEGSMIGTAFSMDPVKVDETIKSLLDLNILISVGSGELMFQHSKTQEVVYSGLSNRWRKALHRNAGLVIESANLDNPDNVLFSLAYHFSNAQDFDKGIDYSISAGYKASNNLAPRESIQFFEKAVELIDSSGRTDERTPEINEALGELYELDGNYTAAFGCLEKVSNSSNETEIQIRVMMKKGRVHQAQSNYDEAILNFEKGIAMADKSGMVFWKAKIHGYMGKIYLRKGMYEQALALQKDYLRESGVVGDARELGQAYMNVGGVYHHLKDYGQAITYWKKAREFFEKVGYKQGIAFVNDNLGVAHLWLGKLDEALEYYRNSEEIMNQVGDVKGLSMVLNNMGVLYDDMGDYSTSLKLYQRSLQIKKRIGDNVGVANIYNNIGSAYFNMGQYEEALRNYTQNYNLMYKSSDTWGISQALNNIAEVEIELGMLSESRKHCRESLELAEKHSFKEILATVYRLIGSLAALEGDFSSSDKYFGVSLAMATEIEEPQKIGMLHLARARSLRNNGSTEKAIDSYAKALDIFDRSNMRNMSTRVRQEMQVLIDKNRGK